MTLYLIRLHTAIESGIKFGVWMMQDNQSRGMLETFLAYLVPDNNLWQYTQNKVIEAKQQGATYSGKRLSEIQTKLCLAWFIARDTVPHTTAHRYIEIII
ncbi:DUF3226 domain-containing protein [Microcystis sp. M090S1]|uniref:DUF3226 domain-containing protein n=1 Tax=Microcystis sp. M090S1 TaxID=2771135 RepID=UPI00258444F6|nr:DUF3226 domain-containing protein [Microcystis sp. M090S1]